LLQAHHFELNLFLRILIFHLSHFQNFKRQRFFKIRYIFEKFFQDFADYYFDGCEVLDEISVDSLTNFIARLNREIKTKKEQKEFLDNIKKSIRDKDGKSLLSNLCDTKSKLPTITNARGDIYLVELER
jgi:hypothetical protein